MASDFGKIIEVNVIDPLKDVAVGTTNTLMNKYTNTKDMIKNVGNPLKKAVNGFANTILKGALKVERTGEYNDYYKEINKEASRIDGKIAKSARDYLYNK